MLKITIKDLVEIKVEIAKRGKSLRSFSKEVGVSQGYLSQILSGKKRPSPKVAYKIANGLNLNIDEIFFIEFD